MQYVHRQAAGGHEFALEELAAANGPECALARTDPKLGRADYVFFPGCQLAASHPHHVESVYAFLREQLSGGVGLMLGCCGVPAHWAGEEALFQASIAAFVEKWTALGRPHIIAACSSCLSVFRHPAFKQAAPDLTAVSLWRELDRLPLPGLGLLPRPSVAVHDPCTARDDPDFRSAVRSILNRLGVPYKELPLSGEQAECCGFGGLMSQVDRPLADQVAARRAKESRRDYIAACAMLQFSDITVDQTTGVITLRALFPNPGHDLLPGLYVRAVLDEGVNDQALLVPQASVSRDGKGNAMVMVVKPDNVVEVRPITVDRVVGDKWLVTGGLAAGERVILEGLQKVRPGAKVNAVEAAATGAQPDQQANATAPAAKAEPAPAAAQAAKPAPASEKGVAPAEKAKPEAAKAAAKPAQAPKAVAPKTDASKTDVRKAEAPKTSAKAEGKTETKAETKAVTKAVTTAETKAEMKPEAKSQQQSKGAAYSPPKDQPWPSSNLDGHAPAAPATHN